MKEKLEKSEVHNDGEIWTCCLLQKDVQSSHKPRISATNAIRTNSHSAVITFRATSERNLPLCGGPREACNIIRQRFWLSPLIHRLCKCPDRTDCPSQKSQGRDKRTVAFNARHTSSGQVGDLDHCRGRRSIAAEIRTNGTISIHCFCGEGHYFQKLYNNATGQYFACLPLASCKTGDFCGHITSSSYETYHICTCPMRHICVLQNRKLDYANEFLYQGQAYKKGVCRPFEDYSK
ncbi:uncharacterized protein CEXT_647471 [Caerostris extrusa]|uniref:Uncharacterized protein n=1 Tax=Caerostris extrusa TaxID=172846 RepID=A0AAV4P0D0_CAEEX|nr:uncharacterized protein CEXT_647471 [Caerostris extrusa]